MVAAVITGFVTIEELDCDCVVDTVVFDVVLGVVLADMTGFLVVDAFVEVIMGLEVVFVVFEVDWVAVDV